MGLFGKKKNEVKDKIKPPTFPGLSEPSFPSYEPSFPNSTDNIKEAISKPMFPESKSNLEEEKAIFVQIDKYKQAIDTLEMIKEKLKTSQSILNELNELKKQEDAEFAEWQSNIEEIKEKLSVVDGNLFEV
jgi:protein subunit release factor A